MAHCNRFLPCIAYEFVKLSYSVTDQSAISASRSCSSVPRKITDVVAYSYKQPSTSSSAGRRPLSLIQIDGVSVIIVGTYLLLSFSPPKIIYNVGSCIFGGRFTFQQYLKQNSLKLLNKFPTSKWRKLIFVV